MYLKSAHTIIYLVLMCFIKIKVKQFIFIFGSYINRFYISDINVRYYDKNVYNLLMNLTRTLHIILYAEVFKN